MVRQVLGTFVIAGLFSCSHVWGQIEKFENLVLDPAGPEERVEAELVADVKGVVPGKPFRLGVKFTVPAGYHFFYKSPGSALPTKVSFAGPKEIPVGEVKFPGPEVEHFRVPNPGVNYVYHHDTIIFAEVAPPATLADGKVSFTADVSYQYCKTGGSCYPPEPKPLTLTLPVEPPNATPTPSEHAALFDTSQAMLPVSGTQTKFAKVTAKPSDTTMSPGAGNAIIVEVAVEKGYVLPPRDFAKGEPTDIILEAVRGIDFEGVAVFPEASAPLPNAADGRGYAGTFSIRVPFKLRKSYRDSQVTIAGLLRFAAIGAEGKAQPLQFASFSVPITVANGGSDPIAATNAGSKTGPAGAADIHPATGLLDNMGYVDSDEADLSLAWYLVYAFLGGLILNVMPCVLPVVAIKTIGFVQQAGESRGRIFLLNVAYSFGVISVFLILATLAAAPARIEQFLALIGFEDRIGWGGLFQRAEFNIFMAGLVFAMGLSLLGVFEIPVPGFAASSSHHGEGLLGAYFTGILATLLATPCSGPFLGVTLGWSVRQPTEITYLVWTLMGVGMAFPYLVIGMFPKAIKWLPKPGNWMVTFKEFAGIVLMGTVVFIIWFLDDTYTVPVLVMLVGLALGFWMIGNLYDINSPASRKWTIRALAVLSSVGIGLFSMTNVKNWVVEQKERRITRAIEEYLQKHGGKAVVEKTESTSELDWQPFTEARLTELVAQGKTVLVDFTADWCLTCKTNESFALNTPETKALVQELGAVALYADYTHRSPEIKKWLDRFRSISVPLTVIFPGNQPDRPIVLRDLFTKEKLLSSLRAAGPSVGVERRAQTPATTELR